MPFAGCLVHVNGKYYLAWIIQAKLRFGSLVSLLCLSTEGHSVRNAVGLMIESNIFVNRNRDFNDGLLFPGSRLGGTHEFVRPQRADTMQCHFAST